MRILIAEDDAILAGGLKCILQKSGYAVDWVKNGAEADAALGSNEFDLLILDISLPRLSGLEVLRRLRARNSRLPVLLLTALDSIEDRVRGLDAGADDYLAKPFQLAELEARTRALTRRGMSGAPTLIRHGRLASGWRGSSKSTNSRLSARELSLLELFFLAKGAWCWGSRHTSAGGAGGQHHASRYTCTGCAEAGPGSVRISTVRGVGYCLEAAAGGFLAGEHRARSP